MNKSFVCLLICFIYVLSSCSCSFYDSKKDTDVPTEPMKWPEANTERFTILKLLDFDKNEVEICNKYTDDMIKGKMSRCEVIYSLQDINDCSNLADDPDVLEVYFPLEDAEKLDYGTTFLVNLETFYMYNGVEETELLITPMDDNNNAEYLVFRDGKLALDTDLAEIRSFNTLKYVNEAIDTANNKQTIREWQKLLCKKKIDNGMELSEVIDYFESLRLAVDSFYNESGT